MASRWRTEAGGEINLAPLLDVIFSLLFFFVLATSLRQERRALEVALPRSSQAPPAAVHREPLEIEITRENRIVFRGVEYDEAGLTQALSGLRQNVDAAARTVIVRADAQADVQTFVTVSDACRQAGFDAVEMQTRRTDAPEAPAEP